MMDEPFRLYVWVCLNCGQQHRGPHGHRLAGDDVCQNIDNPKFPEGADYTGCGRLSRIEVRAVDEGTQFHLSRRHRYFQTFRSRRIEKVTA